MSGTTSKLVALVFDDPYKAEEARAAVHRMGDDGLLETDETALIVKDADGRMRMSQDVNIVGRGQKVGHIAGLVAAILTGTLPFIMAGSLAGRLLGRLTDDGITNEFLKDVSTELQPETSVLILFARSDAVRRQKVLALLAGFGPRLVESDLPAELEQELDAALQGEMKGASGL